MSDVWPLAWLIPLAIYDLRKREVPGMAFVAAPCAVIALIAAWRGEWPLAALWVVTLAASERHRVRSKAARLAVVAAAIAACLALIWLTPLESWPGALSIPAFWLAYEIGWWAGADALAAIALAMLWPDIRLVVCFAASHALMAALRRVRSGRQPLPLALMLPRVLTADELDQFGAPGLPAIALGALLCIVWRTFNL